MTDTSLTLETHVMVLRDGTIVYLNQQQVSAIYNSLQSTSVDFIMVGEKMIMRHAISYVVSLVDYEDTLRRKKGEWRCKLGHWHEKGASCKELREIEDRQVELLDSKERVDINDIIKDQKRAKENRQFERDETRKGWKRVGTNDK
jgi:hypothetical protein